MKLTLPPGPFRAYLFDCDGTIADSMPLHYIAWSKALGEYGCTFDEQLFYSWGGKPAVEIIADLNKMQDLNMPPEALAEHKEDLYFALLPQLQACLLYTSCGLLVHRRKDSFVQRSPPDVLAHGQARTVGLVSDDGFLLFRDADFDP